MDRTRVTRRTFVKNSAAAAAVMAAAPAVLAASNPAPGPNDRIRIGFIGLGGRCQAHFDSAFRLHNEGAPIEIASLCDVFNRYRDEAADKVHKATQATPKVVADYREIIADPTIDAVCISTPDHWHAKQTIDALRARKHVFCEKPMTHTLDEAFDVVRAWRASDLARRIRRTRARGRRPST